MYLPSSSPSLSSFGETIKYRISLQKKEPEKIKGEKLTATRGEGGTEEEEGEKDTEKIITLLQFPCWLVPRARAPNYAIIQIAICVPRLFLVDPDARRVCRAPKCKSRHF